MKRLTPVLMVSDLPASLAFWHEQLGFELKGTVPVDPQGPPDGPLGFAMLQYGAVEMMLQSLDSVRLDVPDLIGDDVPAMDGIGLFVEVDGPLDPWLSKIEGCEVLVPRRQTFYGADEIGVRTPDGATLMLASFGEGEAAGGDSPQEE
ncbi:MAG: hypothetical protein CMJ94_00645 [Planctomycetes bacterium]|nr:hypothetical protein [Planctomycetota bacterium]